MHIINNINLRIKKTEKKAILKIKINNILYYYDKKKKEKYWEIQNIIKYI